MSEPVVIVDYDPGWPDQFERLRARAAAALGDLAVAIEHVGSTSVPGLAAKPIIDMDVAVASLAHVPAAIERLAAIGYVYEGDLGLTGREAFTAPPGGAAHHLYVCTVDAREYRRHLAFRDRLRADPVAARAYGDLKRALAQRHRDDRLAYTDAKDEFVESVLLEELGPN